MQPGMLVLRLADAARRHDQGAITRVLRALIELEEKKKRGGIADQLRRLLPRTGAGGENDKTLEYLTETTPQVSLHDLQLQPAVRGACEELILEQQKADVLARAGMRPRNRILLTGPPGNGKTSIAEAIAAALGRPFYAVTYDTLTGNLLGQTGSRLRRVFEYVTSHDCVVLFDEFEAIGKERNDGHDVGEVKRVVASMLLQMDQTPPGTVIAGATNHPEMLDRGHMAPVPDQAGARTPEQERAGPVLQGARREGAPPAPGRRQDRGDAARNELRRSRGVLRRRRTPPGAPSRPGPGQPVPATAGPVDRKPRTDTCYREEVMSEMSDTTTIVTSIIGTGIAITGILAAMLRILATNITKRIDDLRSDTRNQFNELRSDTTKQLDELKSDTRNQFDELKTDMNSRFTETNSRLQHIETRIDDTNKRIDAVGHDVADLRDRTGALEGSLSTFMNERRNTNAA